MKKKTLAIMLPICTLACASTLALGANAAVGDVVGNILETDIKTYIFDQPINAYNIGGQTVIIVEELIMFDNAVDSGTGLKYQNRFNVQWDGVARTLTIRDDAFEKAPQNLVAATTNPTYPEGYFSKPLPTAIYETEIKTYFLNGTSSTELRSFNIGGQTCIVVEDLMALGYDVQWDGAARTLKVYHRMNNVSAPTTPSTNPDLSAAAVKGQLTDGYLADREYTVTVNGKKTSVNAIVHNGQALFPIETIANLTGVSYNVSGNALLLDTRYATPFTYKRTTPPAGTEQLTMKSLSQLALDPYVTDGKLLDTALIESNKQLVIMQLGSYPINPVLYNGKVYISAEYIHDIIKYHEPTIVGKDTIANTYAPIAKEILRAYDILSADSNELDCDLDSMVTIINGGKALRYVKVEDEWLNWLGITSVNDLVMYSQIFFSPALIEEKLFGADGATPQFIDNNGGLWKLYVENNNKDTYQPIINLETVNLGKTSATFRISAVINGVNKSATIKFSNVNGCTQFERLG